MLSFSTASNLAIHAMAYLAASKSGSPVPTSTIATAIDASPSHLSKVLQGLVKSGLVTSSRGARGGFALGRSADAISLFEVVRAVAGPRPTEVCLLGRQICGPGQCKLHDVRARAAGLIEQELRAFTLDRFVRWPNRRSAGRRRLS